MAKVYLASQYARRDEMRVHREALIAEGHECTSQWLDVDDVCDPIAGALLDLADIDRSDFMICFTEKPEVGYTSGGRHVEMGYGIAKGKFIYVIGPRENIFCAHPQINLMCDIGEAIENL
jgi:hypothetical protein